MEAAGGKVTFREVAAPYVNESMLTQQDFEVEGQVSNKLSSVLIIFFWVYRVARLDLAFPISTLATSSDSSVQELRQAVVQARILFCTPPRIYVLCLPLVIHQNFVAWPRPLQRCGPRWLSVHRRKCVRVVLGCTGSGGYILPFVLEIKKATICGAFHRGR